MRVIIWHNTDDRSRFWKTWEPGHSIERAYTYERNQPDPCCENHERELLEDIFEENQNLYGDPEREPSFRNQARSLSVGDVVQIGDKAWTVAGAGWVECEVPEVK